MSEYPYSVNASKANHHPIGFEFLEWCEKEVGEGQFRIVHCPMSSDVFIAFKEEDKAIMFKLVWSEYL